METSRNFIARGISTPRLRNLLARQEWPDAYCNLAPSCRTMLIYHYLDETCQHQTVLTWSDFIFQRDFSTHKVFHPDNSVGYGRPARPLRTWQPWHLHPGSVGTADPRSKRWVTSLVTFIFSYSILAVLYIGVLNLGDISHIQICKHLPTVRPFRLLWQKLKQ